MDEINHKANMFDLIIASYSIYYSKNIKKLLSKLLRILKKNGEIIIANPYKPHFMVNFVQSVHPIHKKINESLEISDLIYSHLKKNKNLKIKKTVFNNQTKLSKKNILSSYINSTMFEKNQVDKIKLKINKIKNKVIKFNKKTCILKIKKI